MYLEILDVLIPVSFFSVYFYALHWQFFENIDVCGSYWPKSTKNSQTILRICHDAYILFFLVHNFPKNQLFFCKFWLTHLKRIVDNCPFFTFWKVRLASKKDLLHVEIVQPWTPTPQSSGFWFNHPPGKFHIVPLVGGKERSPIERGGGGEGCILHTSVQKTYLVALAI